MSLKRPMALVTAIVLSAAGVAAQTSDQAATAMTACAGCGGFLFVMVAIFVLQITLLV